MDARAKPEHDEKSGTENSDPRPDGGEKAEAPRLPMSLPAQASVVVTSILPRTALE